jgi:LysM domain
MANNKNHNQGVPQMAGGHTNWLIGGGILVAGAVAAMPFYRDSSKSSDAATTISGSELPWSGDPLTLRMPGNDVPISASDSTLRTTLTPLDSAQPSEPPTVDGEYGSLLHQFGGAKSPQQIGSERPLRSLSIGTGDSNKIAVDRRVSAVNEGLVTEIEDAAPSDDTRTRKSFSTDKDEVQAEKSHTVVDGDTLARISTRYYNDPRYAQAIFERNRKILSDPDLLPVGKLLVIPPRDVVVNKLEPIDDAAVSEQLEPIN